LLLALGPIPNQIHEWKKALVQPAPKVFDDRLASNDELSEHKLAEF
jgi:hypothetical protein